ncbi:hypothetical protein ACJ72_01827 [Emergomyces africanus]|uniref:2-deoxy-D-gluconate 3-dehydrogenase n=1 Tax=Emergomyces africanus TaxID=1955775 RepID=A0A1B7P449_9EURO|nr:hypothetical protein ACJ72_01827 [Emergomyces africanus]
MLQEFIVAVKPNISRKSYTKKSCRLISMPHLRFCRDIGKYWIENNMRGCKIVNVASLCTFFGSVKIPVYSMSKGGVGQLTKALSNEWASKGVNVNAIAPGYYIATDMNRDIVTGDPAYLKSITDRIPAGHWGKPEDMKGPVVFLASDAGGHTVERGAKIVHRGADFGWK